MILRLLLRKLRKIGRAPVEHRTCNLCSKRIPNEIEAMRDHLIWSHDYEELEREFHVTKFEYEKLREGFTATSGYNN